MTVDSKMCVTTIDFKIELVKQLGVVLQGSVKPSEPIFRTFVARTECSDGKAVS
jgi:hypothetical protein